VLPLDIRAFVGRTGISARSHALELAEGAEYRSRPSSLTGETAD
jgi:hypothetical protein